ncbi:MAG: tryptophan synthase subunit alpha [Bacteroidales bacterium]|nr:tryptophan synthase subunit alpha [Bacteroidales bacterium]
MNRIDSLFQNKKQGILSVYFTAGYPHLNDTETIITELEKAGADLIEIGFPFSDPVADGPVIQHSSEVSLKNGITLKLLFEQLKNIRQKVKIPLILMGYINPVVQYGIEKFCKDASETGIDGVIVPDLPLEIYLEEYLHVFQQYNIHNIPLIPPQTKDERIKKIDEASTGFIYLVSSSSTTGNKAAQNDVLDNFTARLTKLNLKNPQLIGFGINNKASFDNVCEYARGGIIGTAFIKTLDKQGDMVKNIHEFIESLR